MSQRERGKDLRRTRIIDAAVALTRETGLAGLSVRMIADRAEVSPAKVYERDLTDFERRVADADPADALEAVFDAVAVACSLYRADPQFYRAALRTGEADMDKEMVLATYLPRVAFWRNLAERAKADGWLRPDADAQRLGVLMIQISTGALARWIAHIVSLDVLELETAFGMAVVMSPFATEAGRERLEARQRALAAALSRLEAEAARA
jgi:hypothetical protein